MVRVWMCIKNTKILYLEMFIVNQFYQSFCSIDYQYCYFIAICYYVSQSPTSFLLSSILHQRSPVDRTKMLNVFINSCRLKTLSCLTVGLNMTSFIFHQINMYFAALLDSDYSHFYKLFTISGLSL